MPEVAGGPARHRAAVGRNNGVIVQELVYGVRHHLRLERLGHVRAALLHQLVPLLHVLLGRRQEALVFLRLNQRQQRAQHGLTVAGQADLDGAAQTDALRIGVDLDDTGVAGFGVELHVGEAAAGDKERVAGLHGVLGRGGAQQTDAAGGVGAIVGNHRLAEQRLDDRAADFLGQLHHFFNAADGAAPGQDDDLGAGVDDVGGILHEDGRREGRIGGKAPLTVAGDVVPGSPGIRRRQFLDVLGDANVGDAAAGQGGADGLIDDVGKVGRPIMRSL